MTKTERAVLLNVVARLRNESSGVSPDIQRALYVARHYLEMWCAGPIELIASESRYPSDPRIAESMSAIQRVYKRAAPRVESDLESEEF